MTTSETNADAAGNSQDAADENADLATLREDLASDRPFLAWLDALEFYAQDWDATFDAQSGYFTQEYWYLFVNCLRAYWIGRPLTVSQVTQRMKTGSNRTREERIRRAVDDGYLTKERVSDDGRSVVVLPTSRLERLMLLHFKRTRAHFYEKLTESAYDEVRTFSQAPPSGK